MDSRSDLRRPAMGLQFLTLPVARRPASLKSVLRALFCATHSDWERFDEIFDAYWQDRGRRPVQALVGATANHRVPLRRLGEASALRETGLPDHLRRSHDAARAIDRLSLLAQGIGGGTRIGESLATFNQWHAKRVINS